MKLQGNHKTFQDKEKYPLVMEAKIPNSLIWERNHIVIRILTNILCNIKISHSKKWVKDFVFSQTAR